MEEIFSSFCALLLCGNDARSQHFDIIFEKGLTPAFRIIFRIENLMILWHLDQKIVLTLIENFCRARIGAQFHTDITIVFDVTHGCIQLVKSATVYFTSNFAGIFIGSFSGCSPQINNLGKNFVGPSPRNF